MRGRSSGLPQVYNTSRKGGNGAEIRVTAAPETDNFAADTTLLCGEFKRDEGGRKEVLVRGGDAAEGKVAEEEAYVAEQKGMGAGRSPGVFAGAKQKEKGDAEHVGAGLVESGASQDGLLHGMAQNGDWNGLYPSGRGVGAGVPREHSLKAKVDSTLD